MIKRIIDYKYNLIVIGMLAMAFAGMATGSNNPRHQPRTGSSDYGKGYTILETIRHRS